MRVELPDKVAQYLERQARLLSRDLDRPHDAVEVLELLVELALEDEGVYDPDDGSAISATRRRVAQPERDSSRVGEPAGRFAPQLLLRHLRRED